MCIGVGFVYRGSELVLNFAARGTSKSGMRRYMLLVVATFNFISVILTTS